VWKGLLYFISFSFQHRKFYLAARGGMEFFKILASLSQIVLPGYIINELFGLRRAEYLFLFILLYTGCCFISGLAGSLLKCFAENEKEILRNEFECYIMENYMKCNFIRLENKEYQNLKQRAEQYVHGQWNQFGDVMEKFFSLSGSIITLAGVAYIIVIIDIKVLLLFILLIVVNIWVGSILKAKRMALISGFASVLRRRAYYEDVVKNPAYAKEIRLGWIAKWLLAKYNDYMQVFCKQTVPIYQYDFIQKSVTAVTGFAQQCIMYGYLVWKVIGGYVNVGQFAIYFNAANTFHVVINKLVDTVLELSKYTSLYKDFEKYIQFEPEIETGKEEIGEMPCEIEFRNVSFCYPGQHKYAIENVSVTIKKGEKISVVGENGAGKTTFIKLLIRLYDPTEGQILLDGIDIRELDYNSYMKLFGVVFQDFKLFHISVRDNILLANKEKTDEKRLAEALRIMGLDCKITELPNGIETQVYKQFDKEGFEPSGGEGQKLALCRAYYKNSPFIILDEPTSALDIKAECEIYYNFQMLAQGKTALFISHRLASSRICDKVLVFQEGRLVEQGNHKELMEQRGLYKELFQMQAKYFEAVYPCGF